MLREPGMRIDVRGGGLLHAPLVRAVALALGLACACVPAAERVTVNGHEPYVERAIVRAEDGEPAAVSLLLIPDGLTDPTRRFDDWFVFAAWEDGTTVRSASPSRRGAPLVRAVQEPTVIAHELAGLVSAIRAVPPEEREPSSPDGLLVSLLLRDGAEWIVLQTDLFEGAALCFLGSANATQERDARRAQDQVAERLPSRFVEAWLDCQDRILSLAGAAGEPCDASAYTTHALRQR